jgi:hypothetical protein
MTFSRIALCALASAVCGVAAAAGLAPAAAADVVDVTVMPGLGSPAGVYGSGCTYLVVARATDSRPVSFIDYNTASTFFPQNLFPYWLTPVVVDRAYVLWTPTAPGGHAIMAYQSSAGGPVENVTVDAGAPVGPSCIVNP